MAEQAGTSSQQPLQLEEHHKPESIQERLLYKNRLQEFTQKAKIPHPVYQTFNEGGPHHDPKFRSAVVVDGKTFISSNTFSNRKAAEQEVAKIALEGIPKRIKDGISNKTADEELPPIHEDKVFCKSILYEFAVKSSLEKPTYNTVMLEGTIPTFSSTVHFNGATYTGEACVNKKEAEQLGARAAILSILGESGAGTLLLEIIKSKAELFSAVRKHSCPDVNKGFTLVALNSASDNDVSASKVGVSGAAQAHFPIDNLQRHPPDVPAHEFKKPNEVESISQALCLPITFVPSCQVQPMHRLASARKRKCKNKKKKAKKVKAEQWNLIQAVPGEAQ